MTPTGWSWYCQRCAPRGGSPHRHRLTVEDATLLALLTQTARRRGRWMVFDAGAASRFAQVVAAGHGLLGVELSDSDEGPFWPLQPLPAAVRPVGVRLRRTGRSAPVWFPPTALYRPAAASELIRGHLRGEPLPAQLVPWLVDVR